MYSGGDKRTENQVETRTVFVKFLPTDYNDNEAVEIEQENQFLTRVDVFGKGDFKNDVRREKVVQESKADVTIRRSTLIFTRFVKYPIISLNAEVCYIIFIAKNKVL